LRLLIHHCITREKHQIHQAEEADLIFMI